jgi:hypothetical protein
MELKDLMEKSGQAFETAKDLIFLNKKNQEEKARIEKLIFDKKCKKDYIKKVQEGCEKEEKVLEIASQIFLKEFNLPEDFMDKLEEWIKNKYD